MRKTSDMLEELYNCVIDEWSEFPLGEDDEYRFFFLLDGLIGIENTMFYDKRDHDARMACSQAIANFLILVKSVGDNCGK